VQAHLQSALGLIALRGIAWLVSERRKLVSWRFAAVGTGAQIVLAFVLLELPFATAIFGELNHGVMAIQRATEAGSSFVFGFLGGARYPTKRHAPAEVWYSRSASCR
jgi:CNT family concentrative nucleoside transporter